MGKLMRIRNKISKLKPLKSKSRREDRRARIREKVSSLNPYKNRGKREERRARIREKFSGINPLKNRGRGENINYSLDEYTFKNFSPERWMTQFASSDPNCHFRNICLLGSHDAAMYKITYNLKLVGNERDTLTQNVSIYHQLCAGARFFDIRPALIRKRLYSVHVKGRFGAAGATIDEILSDIKKFLRIKGAEKEVIIISLHNQFYPIGIQATLNKLNQRLARKLIDKLGNDIYPNYSHPLAPFLNETIDQIAKKGRVIVCCKNPNYSNALKKLGVNLFSPNELKIDDPYTSEFKHGDSDMMAEKKGKQSNFNKTAQWQIRKLKISLKSKNVFKGIQWIVRKRLRSPSSIRKLSEYMNRQAAITLLPQIDKASDNLIVSNKSQNKRLHQYFPNFILMDSVDQPIELNNERILPFKVALSFTLKLGGKLLNVDSN